MSLDTYLPTLNGRCHHGAHLATQGCPDCTPRAPVTDKDEWATFVAALHAAVRADGTIHQTDMRPLIAGIFHKHRGPMYVRARTEGLIEFVGKEPSTDFAGGNGDKDQKVYRLVRAAVAA